MKKHVHPQYSVLDPFSVKVEDDHGVSLGLHHPVPFAVAGRPKSTLQNDIEVDEAIHTSSLHEGGGYRLGDGTVTLPILAFAGSPKTGLYRISANTMGLTVNGTLVATIDSTGIHPIAATAIGPIATDRILGRDTAGSGSVEELTVTGGLEFTGSTGIQSSAHTGDVTKAAGGTATTIANDAVTNAKAADMAQDTIKGRASGAGTGDPTDLSATQATAILNNMVGDSGAGGTKGLAPAPAAGDAAAGKFLKADGTWEAPATGGTNALLDGSVHTDTANRAPLRGALIIGESTPVWTRLAIGSADFVLKSDGTDVAWARNDGTTVYVPTTSDFDISEVTDVTIVTRDVTGVVAGNQIVVEGEFTILNDSGSARVYVVTIDFDGLFDIEITTAALAVSSTLIHPFSFRAVLDVRSTSLSYMVVCLEGYVLAGVAAGGDTTMSASHLSGKGWGTSTTDVTGTATVTLKIRSASATGTQTLRLHCFEIRKLTPT